MQATVSQLAIREKANWSAHWSHEQHHARPGSGPPSSTSGPSPSSAPGASADGCRSWSIGLVLYGVSWP